MTDNVAVAVERPPEPKQRQRRQPADAKPKVQPPDAVVVFNDDLHTLEYVIETFTKVFGYWNKDPQKVDQDPKHTGLRWFLKAKNNHRRKFCLLVANHGGYMFPGADEWQKAAEGRLPYFKHPQHVTVAGKPPVPDTGCERHGASRRFRTPPAASAVPLTHRDPNI